MQDYQQSDLPTDPPVIGYLERQCREKGLATLIEAFIVLRKNDRVKNAKLRVAGGKLAEDDALLKEMRGRLAEENLIDDVEFLPNLSYEDRLDFLRSLSIMSVPAEHKDAFGIYIIESLAAGVPVVQPSHGAFPELLEITGGGILCEPDNPEALAAGMETLLLNPEKARELGMRGQKAVSEKFTVELMSRNVMEVLEKITSKS